MFSVFLFSLRLVVVRLTIHMWLLRRLLRFDLKMASSDCRLSLVVLSVDRIPLETNKRDDNANQTNVLSCLINYFRSHKWRTNERPTDDDSSVWCRKKFSLVDENSMFARQWTLLYLRTQTIFMNEKFSFAVPELISMSFQLPFVVIWLQEKVASRALSTVRDDRSWSSRELKFRWHIRTIIISVY